MAARYYFNKDVRDLNLVESAFIAGSVKAPQVQSVYQVLKNERAVAVEAANDRKNTSSKICLIRLDHQTNSALKPTGDRTLNHGEFRTSEVAG